MYTVHHPASHPPHSFNRDSLDSLAGINPDDAYGGIRTSVSPDGANLLRGGSRPEYTNLPVPLQLMNDPAFSLNPRLHPHFATEDEAPRPGGQRRLKKGSASKHTQHSPTDASQTPFQIPSSPQRYPHEPPTYDSNLQVIYAASPTTSSNSTSSHASTTPPTSTSSNSAPTSTTQVTLGPSRTPHGLPPDLRRDPERPIPSHSISAPELQKTPQRPSQSPRHHSSDSRSSKGKRRLPQTTALDKIDELDESDPFHFGWHHDGPYEAVKHNAMNPSQKINNRHLPKPSQFSFDVKPGQVIPPYQTQIPSSNSEYYYQSKPRHPDAPRPQHPAHGNQPPLDQTITPLSQPRHRRSHKQSNSIPLQPQSQPVSNVQYLPPYDYIPEAINVEPANHAVKEQTPSSLRPSDNISGPKPPVQHVPKKLVMPAPLQGQQQPLPPSQNRISNQGTPLPSKRSHPVSNIRFAPDKVHDYAQDYVSSVSHVERTHEAGKLLRKKTADPDKAPRRRLSKKRND